MILGVRFLAGSHNFSGGPEKLYCNYQEEVPVGKGQGVASSSPKYLLAASLNVKFKCLGPQSDSYNSIVSTKQLE